MAKPKTRDQALFYLAGLWDGEGCIVCTKRSNGYDRRMDVVNTDPTIMDAAAYALDLLEIPYRLEVRKNAPHKPLERIVLSEGRPTFEFMLENLPLGSQRKREKLKELVETYQDSPDRPTKDELHRMYVVEDLNTAQMGEIFSVSQRSICNWLRDAGISRRPAHRRKGLQVGQA